MDDTEKSLEAYETLYKNIPSIGFLNQKKRVQAYLTVTQLAQQMIDKQDISDDQALYLLSILTRKHSPFQKATMMTALHLDKIARKRISSIGFQFANNFRCNLHMLPVDE